VSHSPELNSSGHHDQEQKNMRTFFETKDTFPIGIGATVASKGERYCSVYRQITIRTTTTTMNTVKYPWLSDLTSPEATKAIQKARAQFQSTGAVIFANFITELALEECVDDATAQEDGAFTTDDTHTAYLSPSDPSRADNSVYNHEMRTQVASVAFDELSAESRLAELYKDPLLLQLVSSIVQKDLYLSEDPIGCCSINVFRPTYHHSFHFDESEFSTTLMLQEAACPGTGLFQYTDPLRDGPGDLALPAVAAAVRTYDDSPSSLDVDFAESASPSHLLVSAPKLHTLNFRPGTLSIFSGSRSLHRVTTVEGPRSRLVAVLTFATFPGFRNSAKVQKLFWGRSIP
jgi:hypothetical protein